MAMQVARTGTSRDSGTGLSCSSLEVRGVGLAVDLPALSATCPDYDHASRAGERLDAFTFNHYHKASPSRPLGHRSTLDSIAARVRAVQERHRPPLTLISVEHTGGVPDGYGLARFHEMQRRLGLPIITTVEKDPDQGIEGMREELETVEKSGDGREVFPTISVKTEISDFEEKLRYVARNYLGFNLQWGGYALYFDRWRALSGVLSVRNVWCNVVGITPRYRAVSSPTGQKIHPSNMGVALMCGGHSHCFAWPRRQPQAPGPKKPPGRGGGAEKATLRKKPMLFSPKTWCYDPCGLTPSVARTRSFNAVQAALALARKRIRDGTFYGQHCNEAPGLREAMARVTRGS